MSQHKSRTTSASSEPRRALNADFTARTVRYAATARQRMNAKQQRKTYFKELFSMKSTKFLSTLPGAAVVAFAVIATTGVSAYTITNWFGTTADNARQEGNVLSVDLSDCNRDLPNVAKNSQGTAAFEVTGTPHISAADLQSQLLAGCAYYTILDFYMQDSPYGQQLSTPYSDAKDIYGTVPGTIKEISQGTATIVYRVLGGDQEIEVNLAIASDATVYQQRQQANIGDLAVGDHAVFMYKLPGTFDENLSKYGPGFTIHPPADATIVSMHKATTDVTNSIAQKDFYEKNNVKPLGWEEKAPQH